VQIKDMIIVDAVHHAFVVGRGSADHAPRTVQARMLAFVRTLRARGAPR